jgi:hypothetical protein
MNWKIIKKVAGVLFIVLGLLAFLTPLTPGGWLVFVGAELLGIEMLSKRRVTEQYGKLKSWIRKKRTGKDNDLDPTTLS